MPKPKILDFVGPIMVDLNLTLLTKGKIELFFSLDYAPANYNSMEIALMDIPSYAPANTIVSR